MTARKPDNFVSRSRVSTVRVETPARNSPSSSRVQVRVVEAAKKTSSSSTKVDDGQHEVARKESRTADADDSIAARLDKWETLDDRLRLEQSVHGKFSR